MSFVFRDASTAEQQKRNWKTAERKVERESQAQGNVMNTQSHTAKGKPWERNSLVLVQVTSTHPFTHTPHPLRHTQQHRERTMQVASGYEKLFYGCFYSRLHLSLAPIFLCVCASQCAAKEVPLPCPSFSLGAIQPRFACFWSPFSCLLILIYDSWLFCFPFSALSLQLCRRLSVNENGNENWLTVE